MPRWGRGISCSLCHYNALSSLCQCDTKANFLYVFAPVLNLFLYIKVHNKEPKNGSLFSICFYFFCFFSIHKPSKYVANVNFLLKNDIKFCYIEKSIYICFIKTNNFINLYLFIMLNLFIILSIFVLFFIHAYSLEFRKFTKYDGILSIGLLFIAVISTLNLFLTLID